MRILRRSMLLGLALFAWAGAEARAQTPGLPGTYTYQAQGSDNIERAINDAISGMNFITRPIARGRLKKTNEPYQTLVISQSGGQVSITTDGRSPIVTPVSGQPVKWTREDGEVLDVSTRWVGGALEQVFRAEDGQRTNLYTLNPDGTLSMKVTVASPRLPEPMVYTLKYRPVG